MSGGKWFVVGVLVVALTIGAYLLGQNLNNQEQLTNTSANNSIQQLTQTSSAVQIQPQVQNATVQPSYDYPHNYTPMTFSPAAESQRNSFVNGCTSSGGTWGKCNCDFDYLIENYGVVWLIDANAYINVNGAASPQYRVIAQQAAQSCSEWSN
ncbi:MAG TPA: hypothetical protein VMA75_03300 [Candidatus Paceibacterota bacterium]|nr:hypothetical protein [Candidatus Paceibacterota bacterium]